MASPGGSVSAKAEADAAALFSSVSSTGCVGGVANPSALVARLKPDPALVAACFGSLSIDDVAAKLAVRSREAGRVRIVHFADMAAVMAAGGVGSEAALSAMALRLQKMAKHKLEEAFEERMSDETALRSEQAARLTQEEEDERVAGRYWERLMHRSLKDSVIYGRQILSETALAKLLDAHKVDTPAKPAAVPAEPNPSFFGAETLPPVPMTEDVDGECLLCSETRPVVRVCSSCPALVCKTCFARFASARIQQLKFAVPVVLCPGCTGRLPATVWKPLVEENTVAHCDLATRAIFTIRCATCNQGERTGYYYSKVTAPRKPHSIWPCQTVVPYGPERDFLAQSVFSSLPKEQLAVLCEGWSQFSAGRQSADQLVRLILCTFLSTAEADEVEKADHPVRAPEPVADLFLPTGADQTDGWGLIAKHSNVGDPTATGCRLLRLVEDPERRAALLFAFLRRYSLITSIGCGCELATCFKCKSEDAHPGVLCEHYIFNNPASAQACPQCCTPSDGFSYGRSKLCICGTYWEYDTSDEEIRYPPCWGEQTWILLENGKAVRLGQLKVGDLVRTIRGSKAVSRIWLDDISHPRNIAEVVRFRNLWVTSHHPVFVGNDWRYPAELAPSMPAKGMATVIGKMYNLELEGHEDVVLLAGDGPAPAWPLTVSCTIGKYMGPRFGFGVWTRRSTRCNTSCEQCDSVYMPEVDFSDVPQNLRWKHWPAFRQVEYDGVEAQGRVVWNSTLAREILQEYQPAAQRA